MSTSKASPAHAGQPLERLFGGAVRAGRCVGLRLGAYKSSLGVAQRLRGLVATLAGDV